MLDHIGEIYEAKHYDYKCEKVDNHYQIWRRVTDLDEWLEYCVFVVVDGILFTNWTSEFNEVYR